MFFKQVRRNAAKNRKGNGLFFGSLVVAIIAFYTLLSLGEQDVMRYLATIERDAVQKLMALLPVVYVVSLFFVFFLVYFACQYQIDNRRRELGMYLMLGMKQSRMFAMLLCETLWNSAASLLVGLPLALLLTEGISLATAKVAGLGIIGHHFSFSPGAVVWTVCGYILVQLLSMLQICARISKTEPADFFCPDTKKQTISSGGKSTAIFTAGLGFLLFAYYLGMFWMRTFHPIVTVAVVVFGILGTFLLYRGLGGFLGRRIRKKSPELAGLGTFTARQVQENVLSQHKSLAISSLLLMMSLACISYGISMGYGRSADKRSVDFSLFGEDKQIDEALGKAGVRKMVKDEYPLYLSIAKEKYMGGKKGEFDTSELKEALHFIKDSDGLAENIIENLHIDYVIAESSYNRILKNVGKEEMNLSDNQVALFSSMAREGDGNFGVIFEKVLKNRVSIGIDGKNYQIAPTFYGDNIVADRAITLYLALIVPDELYATIAREPEPYCRNLNLRDDVVEEMGLMQAIQNVNAQLTGTGIEYDSYLGGIGRNLFYTVAASYLTIYLGVLFWLIANTVIGLKYLIGQRQTKHRYETLAIMGADTDSMCRSVKKQIRSYFLLTLATALASSAAAIYTMFTSFTKLPAGDSIFSVAALSAVALVVFAIVEILYISLAVRAACREIRQIVG